MYKMFCKVKNYFKYLLKFNITDNEISEYDRLTACGYMSKRTFKRLINRWDNEV